MVTLFMLLIIDNESKLIKSFEEKLKERNIEYEVRLHSEQIDFNEKEDIQGIVLTGGPLGPYNPDLNTTSDFVALMNFDVPILGVCLGHEIIAIAFEGKVEKLENHQKKDQKIIIDKKDKIFDGLEKEIYLKERHDNHVSKLPKDFVRLAHSEICPVEIMRHKEKPIYGSQSHPEASGKDGYIIMRNFLKICGIDF